MDIEVGIRRLEVVTVYFKVLVILKSTAIRLGMPAVLHGSTETRS